MQKTLDLISGAQRFETATYRAFWQEIIGHLRGKPARLLSFDDVRTRLRLREESYGGLQDIPVSAIVGSVGRYQDFTASFLPKSAISRERWSRIYAEAVGALGLPPIEVYRVAGVYFVRDGNHRVSVAHELGYKTIQAYVTVVDGPECLTQLLMNKQMDAAEAYMTFMDETGLRSLCEAHDLMLSEPSRYGDLLGHLNLHRCVLEEAEGRPVSLNDAALHWYEQVYAPAVEMMRRHEVLDHAGGRTETDMYLWLVDHLCELEGCYNGQAADLAPALVSFLKKRRLPVPDELLAEAV
jgi:uncharacterized ParB-like nuclease family protein